jgi:hypothetical protein
MKYCDIIDLKWRNKVDEFSKGGVLWNSEAESKLALILKEYIVSNFERMDFDKFSGLVFHKQNFGSSECCWWSYNGKRLEFNDYYRLKLGFVIY